MITNESAERSLIACIVLEPEKVLPIATIEIELDDFQFACYRKIYEKCLGYFQDGKPVDPVTIAASFGTDEEEYKKLLTDAAIMLHSTSNYQAYLNIVSGTGKLARAQREAYCLIDAVDSGEPLEACYEIASRLLAHFDGKNENDGVTAKEGMKAFLQNLNKPRDYIKTGIKRIDKFTYISPGDYVVVGGRPSTGKTAITLQIMAKMAEQKRAVYFSLETKPEKIFERLIACYTMTDFGAIKTGRVESTKKIFRRKADFEKLNFTVVHAAGWSVAQIKAKAIQLKAEVVFIDYLGLIAGKGKSAYETSTQISLDLHTMAQQLGVALITLVQLNRAGKEDPDMTSLRDSGQIEQDADVIMLLDSNRDEIKQDNGRRDLIVCKNKEGRTGKIKLHFDGQHQLFTEVYEKQEENP